jgi:hypothetical protein
LVFGITIPLFCPIPYLNLNNCIFNF